MTHRWMDERFRPQFHYTAEKNMINDPNGLVYYDGEWHLFHQYNQHEVVHWGHAISEDLVHWRHLPPAIHPDVNGQIYSGTAVIDHADTSGLRTGEHDVFVAYFTHADHSDATQSQGLAYSNDRGRTWTMHPDNPLLPNPGQKDFRDPKVFWHAATAAWVMVVTGGDHVEFFRSPDLISWEFAARWGQGHGAHGGVWECPDLFELRVDDTAETRWVLSVSVDRGAPAGGSGMQYFVGAFDGHTFVNDHAPELVLWQNWGKDYYAGITWENAPDGRRVMIAWADNWLYRFDIPTSPFNGQLTVPRELRLVRGDDGIRMAASPVEELAGLRQGVVHHGPTSVSDGEASALGRCDEIVLTVDVDRSSARRAGISIGATGSETEVGYDADGAVVYLDRSRSLHPHPEFAGRHEVAVAAVNGTITLRVLIDRSSVEVFIDDREQITDLILPDVPSNECRLFAVGGDATFGSVMTAELARIWPQREVSFVAQRGEWAETVLGLQGSSTGLGVATIGTGREVAASVDLLGTIDGNPTSLLGESQAGVVLDFDANTGSGVAIVLDRPQGVVRVERLPDRDKVASAALRVMTNTAYDVRATGRDGIVTVSVDGDTVLRVPTDVASGLCGVLVDNAEAVFRHVELAD